MTDKIRASSHERVPDGATRHDPMTTVLVTGGAGAIGGNLVRLLLERGFSPIVLDDLSSGHQDMVPNGVRFIQGSVDCDADLDAAFAAKPAYILHLAALFANQNSVDHPERDLAVNALGTLKVLERCRRHGVTKLLYTSSSCVYGHKAVMDEADENFVPDTPYAISKLAGERYARFYASQHSVDAVIVRLFNAYGPGEYPGKYRNVIPNFFKLALEGKPLPITGDGSETRDFSFVRDTVEGILGALTGPTKPGDVFNIASGRETSIRQLAEAINALAGNEAGIEYRPRRSWDQVRSRRGNTARAQEVFGYHPRVSLSEGLRQTYEWLRTRIG
jgi:nucleoside-diphosphate-sugar epimerase